MTDVFISEFETWTTFLWHLCFGFSMVFTMLSGIVWYKTKDRVFLNYGLYLVLILVYLMTRIPYSSVSLDLWLITNIKPFIRFLQILAFATNFYFVCYFLDIHIKYVALFETTKKVMKTLVVLSFFVALYTQLTNNGQLSEQYYFYVYSVFSFVFVVYFFIKIIKLKERLKIYFIVGNLFYFLATLIAMILSIWPIVELSPIRVFYIGLLVEIIVFSIGLGLKIEMIYVKRMASKIELKNLREAQNELLKTKINQKEEELKNLYEKSESRRIHNLELKYEKEINKLKVDALRNQMNPHFIFNSLNSIKLYIINNEKENAVYYLNKFSKLIRLILLGSNKKETSLNDEIEFIKLYVNIENIRFNNEIEFEINVDPNVDVSNVKIPPMALQPYIENAIWHGLSSKENDKKINIEISNLNEDYVSILIKDNGIGRVASSKIKKSKVIVSKSVGLSITEDRFKNFSKDYKHVVEINIVDLYKDDLPTGTAIEIKMPINKIEISEL